MIADVTDPARLPVLIGAGQLKGQAGHEPRELLREAVLRAVADTGAPQLLGQLDDLAVVPVMSWAYDDLPGQLARRLGIAPARSEQAPIGGNQPVELLLQAAQRIADGTSTTAVVCGGEAAASCVTALRAGSEPDWSREPGGIDVASALADQPPGMVRYGLHLPVRSYPLYELPLAARLGQTPEQAHRWSAQLCAQASRVAAGNEAAWDPQPRTIEQIATVAGKNRLVASPYPVLMTARPLVDQAAAVVLTSAQRARELGVAADRQVHVLGGARGSEARELSDRPVLDAAPALEAVLARTLDAVELTAGQLSALDLYSCFPIVPKLALLALGLPPDTAWTVTGGLTSFGGPGNAYSTFALVAMVARLRAGASRGLVYANGEHLTKHCAAVLARTPHPAGYAGLADVAPPARPAPVTTDRVCGVVAVEACTVEHDRAGVPTQAFLICRDEQHRRLYATSTDRPTLHRLLTDPAGSLGLTLDAAPTGAEQLTTVRLPG